MTSLRVQQRMYRQDGLENTEIFQRLAHEDDLRSRRRNLWKRVKVETAMIGDGTQTIPEAHQRRITRSFRVNLPIIDDIEALSAQSPERAAMVREAAEDRDILSDRVSPVEVKERHGLTFEEFLLSLSLARNTA